MSGLWSCARMHVDQRTAKTSAPQERETERLTMERSITTVDNRAIGADS